MVVISLHYILPQKFHVLRKIKSGSLKSAHSPSLCSSSLFFQGVQHITLADVEPHAKKQVIPTGLHKEEAAGAQVRAHCHGLWHGGVREPLHPAQLHVLPIYLETKSKSEVRCRESEERKGRPGSVFDHVFPLLGKSDTSWPRHSMPQKAAKAVAVGAQMNGRMQYYLHNQRIAGLNPGSSKYLNMIPWAGYLAFWASVFSIKCILIPLELMDIKCLVLKLLHQQSWYPGAENSIMETVTIQVKFCYKVFS